MCIRDRPDRFARGLLHQKQAAGQRRCGPGQPPANRLFQHLFRYFGRGDRKTLQPLPDFVQKGIFPHLRDLAPPMAHPATPDPCPVASDLDRQGDRRNRHRMRLSQHLALHQTLPQTIRHDTRDLPQPASRTRRVAADTASRSRRTGNSRFGNGVTTSDPTAKACFRLCKPSSPAPRGRRGSFRATAANFPAAGHRFG